MDKEKPILRQITAARSDARFYFVVKFYPPNPADLEEEYTRLIHSFNWPKIKQCPKIFVIFRYLFALQIKRDLTSGQFVVNENTAALMASYIVQCEWIIFILWIFVLIELFKLFFEAECGDFCNEDYPDHTYLSTARFIPNQSPDFEKKVMENHKKIMYTI